MKSLGEKMFFHLPPFAAKIYDRFLNIKPIEIQHKQIAQDLISRLPHGRLLDIGTGPGRLLMEIHKLNPEIELYGLDIAKSMIQLAKKNLVGIQVNLSQGNIHQTHYENDFFDAITCTGSFYLWDHPKESLEEIFRILKENRSAYLFEIYRDCNIDEFKQALKVNLREVNFLRKIFSPFAINKAIRMSYRIDEVEEIIKETIFAQSYRVENIILSRLPIWMRITLTKKPPAK